MEKMLATLEAEHVKVSNMVKYWIALLRGQNDVALEYYREALLEGDFTAFQGIQG